MIVFYDNGVSSRQLTSYKLTIREFEEKYPNGYDGLVQKVLLLVKTLKTKSIKIESEHRILLESLFSKKKLLKKHQEELEMVREIFKANLKEEQVTSGGKPDPRDELTEVFSYNKDSFHQEESENTDAMIPMGDKPVIMSKLLNHLRHEVGGNLHKERVIAKLVSQIEDYILKLIKKIETIAGVHPVKVVLSGRQQYIWKASSELDQFITGQQSRLSLGDYTLNDVSSLFANVGEHRKLVVRPFEQDDTRWTAEDMALMSDTMQHDCVISSFLAPGEFAALVDNQSEAVFAMIYSKQAAHSNLRERLNSSIQKYAGLVAEIFMAIEQSKVTGYSSRLPLSARKDDIKSEARSTQDSRTLGSRRLPPVMEDDSDRQLIAGSFRKQTLNQASDQWIGKGKSQADRRVVSSIQNRRDSSEQLNLRMNDKELKSYMREKNELMSLYPQLKDMESGRDF